jgi:hypothetical protein
MRRATRDDHDPAVSWADPLPVACPFAAFDLVHVQHRCGGTPSRLVTQPESSADPLSNRYRLGVCATKLASEGDGLLWRQMGKPQPSGRGGEGRVTEPLSFGVTSVGVQRQVDCPALEAHAGQQVSNLTKIICRDPVSSHGGQYLNEYPRTITAASK